MYGAHSSPKRDVTGLCERNSALAAVVLCVLVAAFSACASGLDLCIDIVAGGMNLPVARVYPFLWAVSGALMLMFTGLCCLSYPMGAVVAITAFALGMGTAMLGPEMLPDFWADYVCPWAPQAFTGSGLRDIIYFGTDPLAGDVGHLCVMGGVGIAALAVAVVVAYAVKRQEGGAGEDDGAE